MQFNCYVLRYCVFELLICVGFVAAAVSMPIGGCRARRSLVVDVDVSVATELTVL